MLNDKILIQFYEAKRNVRFFTESQKTESVPIMCLIGTKKKKNIFIIF